MFVHGLFGHPYDTWTSGHIDDAATQPSTSIDLESRNTATRIAVGQNKQHAWKFWRKEKGDTKEQSSGEEVESAKPQIPSPNKRNALFWPKELLPDAIPQSRIYTWGYDVDVNHIFSSAGQATVFQHARSLLSDLANERSSDEDVCHKVLF